MCNNIKITHSRWLFPSENKPLYILLNINNNNDDNNHWSAVRKIELIYF